MLYVIFCEHGFVFFLGSRLFQTVGSVQQAVLFERLIHKILTSIETTGRITSGCVMMLLIWTSLSLIAHVPTLVFKMTERFTPSAIPNFQAATFRST